jgi:hypothetical protein
MYLKFTQLFCAVACCNNSYTVSGKPESYALLLLGMMPAISEVVTLWDKYICGLINGDGDGDGEVGGDEPGWRYQLIWM